MSPVLAAQAAQIIQWQPAGTEVILCPLTARPLVLPIALRWNPILGRHEAAISQLFLFEGKSPDDAFTKAVEFLRKSFGIYHQPQMRWRSA